MKDQEIISLLRSGKQTKALDEMYKGFPAIRRFILQHGGNEEDARDIFQESLVVFCRNARKPDFTLSAATSTYLFSICRYMWKDELVKKNRYNQAKDIGDIKIAGGADGQELLENREKISALEKILTSLGEKCREVLNAYYYENLSMKDIAAAFGFSSEQVAKNQKYKCLEKAREMARQTHKTEMP